MADQQTINERQDLARSWLALGMPPSATAAKLQREIGISRATAYRTVEAALNQMSQSDAEPDRQEQSVDIAAQALAVESMLAAQCGEHDAALKLARAAETLAKLRGTFAKR